MNKVQPGIFDMILENVISAEIAGVTGKIERKLTCVAAVKFLTECPSVIDRPGAFAKLTTGVIEQCIKPDDAEPTGEDDDALLEEMEANAGYAASYSKLTQGAVKEIDPVPDVTDVRRFVAERLAQFSTTRSIAPLIAQTPQAVQAALGEYCRLAGARVA